MLRGAIRPPGDKSLTHRAFLFAAMARGESRIEGGNGGEDCRSLLGALRALGVGVDGEPPGAVCIRADGVRAWRSPTAPLDLGNSGTALRLLLGALAPSAVEATLSGDASLRSRPMLRVVEPLRRMGARIDGERGGELAPLTVRGTPLRGIRFLSPVPSAQVKSAVLLAGLGAEGVTAITEPAVSRDHTERMLKAMGAKLAYCDENVRLTPGGYLSPIEWSVPRDPSAAAFFIAAAAALPGSEVTAEGVDLNPTRIGFVDVLKRMGADVAIEQTGETYREPLGNLRATGRRLAGASVPMREIPRLIDEVPILAAVAALAEGETRFEGVGELRVKESDRLAAIVDGLRAMGVEALADETSLVVRGVGAKRLGGATIESRGDHRIAMAFALLAVAARGETRIGGARMIETSYPGFETALESLRSGA